MSVIVVFFRGLTKGFTSFGKNINLLFISGLLSITYLVGVGATSLYAKITGKRFLDLGNTGEASSNWTRPNAAQDTEDNYYRQY